jgi:hypothetical protein
MQQLAPERACHFSVGLPMDIRAEIHTAYRNTYQQTQGDEIQALLEAAARFTELAGYAPRKPILDKLLRGAMLGPEHPLMKLLDRPPLQSRVGDRTPPAAGLRFTGK